MYATEILKLYPMLTSFLLSPKLWSYLLYTTDDLKMKKKESTNTVTSRQVVKEMYSEANVTVLCVYSWNYISGFSADTQHLDHWFVSLVPIRLYSTGRRYMCVSVNTDQYGVALRRTGGILSVIRFRWPATWVLSKTQNHRMGSGWKGP